MIWHCPKCGNENKEVSGICGGCFTVRPENIILSQSDEERLAESFGKSPAPSWFQRMFSLRHRITRADFALLFALSLAFRFVPVILNPTPEPALPLVVISYCVGLFVLFVSAGKRARDMGHSGWWGVLSVFIIFGLVILLFGRGDKGPNKYGPVPGM